MTGTGQRVSNIGDISEVHYTLGMCPLPAEIKQNDR